MPMAPEARSRYNGDVVVKGDPDFGDILVLGDAADALLTGVRPPGATIDEIARRALDAVRRPYVKAEIGELAGEMFAKAGLSASIQRVTDRLNRGGLTDAERLLCSDPDVYGALLLKALSLPTIYAEALRAAIQKAPNAADDPIFELVDEAEGIDPNDTESIVKSVRRNLRAENYLSGFEAYVAETVFRSNGISIAKMPGKPTAEERQRFGRLLARLRSAGVSIVAGTTERQVLGLQHEVASEGSVPSLIDAWAAPRNLKVKIDDAVMGRMVAHLQRSGVDLTIPNAQKIYADTFALAYDTAVRSATSSADPITLTRPQAQTLTPWDFRVDTFEAAEEQGVLPENIRAAGALDYVWWLGEVLNVYRLADALVLRWAAGMLDISTPETSSKLYRFWQLRDDRVSAEERGMVYRRVLGRGDAQVLSRMVVNDAFQPLWHTLMEKVAEYTELTADAARELAVSRIPVQRATKDLQFNLTENMTGMALLQVTDMYMQLREAFDLLGADEVTAQLSMGRRRSVWTTIDRLHRDELGSAPDIAGLRTLAVEGNKAFQWIADFDPGRTDGDFETFRDAAEAWIIAAASVGEAAPAARDGDEEPQDPWADDSDLKLDDAEEDAW